MRQRLNFWAIGGDPRQMALARSLSEDGHTVHTYALERGGEPALCADSLAGAAVADCVVLPLPAAEGEYLNAPLSSLRLPMAQVLDALRPGQLLCAGMATPALEREAEGRGLTFRDYFHREELAIANAVPGVLAVWATLKAAAENPAAAFSMALLPLWTQKQIP